MKRRWIAALLALLMVMGTVGMVAAEEDVTEEELLEEEGPPDFVIQMQEMKAEQKGDDMDEDEEEDDEQGPPDFVLEMKEQKIHIMSKNKLKIHGNPFVSGLPPVIKDGRVLIPVGALVKSLGAEEVEWNGIDTITIMKDGTIFKLVIGENTLTINDKEVLMDVEAQILGNRTYVPLKAIALAMGEEVKWDPESKTVNVGRKLGHERSEEAKLNNDDNEDDDDDDDDDDDEDDDEDEE